MKTIIDAVNELRGDIGNLKKGNTVSIVYNKLFGFSDYWGVNDTDLGGTWQFVCTTEEFNAMVAEMSEGFEEYKREYTGVKEAVEGVELGLKHDQDKPMYNLLPANAIDSLAKVLTFGANKYAPNSWQNVEDGIERYRAALLRHTFAMQRGELIDEESGLPHSAHAMCCAAFINELEVQNDSPKK